MFKKINFTILLPGGRRGRLVSKRGRGTCTPAHDTALSVESGLASRRERSLTGRQSRYTTRRIRI